MIDLNTLQGDHAVLTQLLEDRRAVTMETAPIGLRLVWQIYLHILEDALSTLNSLIEYVDKKEKPASLGG